MSTRLTLAAGCLCAISGAAGFASASPPSPPPSTPAGAATKAPAIAHGHAHADRSSTAEVKVVCTGASPGIAVDLEPVRSVVTDGREQLDLALSVDSQTSESVRLVHSVDVMDDLGNLVHSYELGPVRTLARGARLALQTLRTPNSLADGFYEVRVQVAADIAGHETGVRHDKYFEVAAGALIPLTFEEWTRRSRAGQGQ